MLGRPIEHNRSPETDKAKEHTPWLGFDLTFRPSPTAHIAWALGDDKARLVLELCQGIARDSPSSSRAPKRAKARRLSRLAGARRRALLRRGSIRTRLDASATYKRWRTVQRCCNAGRLVRDM